jgi:histidinol phosphatase-like enzyme
MFRILDQHYRIDVSKTMMVGDMDSDKKFAENLGAGYMHIDEFLKSKPE